MKRIVFLVLATLVLTGCQNSEVRYTQDSAEIDVIKAHIDDYEKKNWEGWRSHYSDTAKTFFNTKDSGIGPDSALELLKEGVAGLSSYGFEKDDGDMEMVVDDKGRTWVNFWGNWKGTLEANNETLEIPVHLTYQMIDSKIVREYGYWDNAPRMKAEMEIAASRESKSAVMTRTKDATMKKDEPKKKVAKNKDTELKKN